MSATVHILLFASVANALTEFLFKPVRSLITRIMPGSVVQDILDFLTPYVAWAIAGVLVWFSQINLFAETPLPPTIGVIATSTVAVFAATKLHDFFKWPETAGAASNRSTCCK